jgi:hypothetical protein
MTNCRLCEKAAQLCKSHIIPEFLYGFMYDEKHRFYQLSTSEYQQSKLLQKGLYELLLCRGCEQKFSVFELYASRVLNGGIELTYIQTEGFIKMKGLDYKLFKLFALSILWRASISSLDMFKNVKLGRHEEKLREMLINEDPGAECDYPFVLSPIIYDAVEQAYFIIKPEKVRIEGQNTYRFVFCGIVWCFLVCGHQASNTVVSASINKLGELVMLPRELSKMKFIVDLAKELRRQGKLKIS